MPFPSALLDDHLDGRSRPSTVIELHDLAITTRRSLMAAFSDRDSEIEIWEDVIGPPCRRVGADVDEAWR